MNTGFKASGIFEDLGYLPQKEVEEMAKTEEGKKIVHVQSYIRKLPNGKAVKVEEHYRSTLN